MKKYLLGGKGTFYKANLHLHTVISDGHWTAQQAKEEYQKRGYSILAYTDHEVIVPHNDLSDENFLAITAYEGTVNERIANSAFPFIRTYHLNFYAKDKQNVLSPCFTEKTIWLKHTLPYVTDEMRKFDYPTEYTVECVNDMIRLANEHGFLVTWNHPVWSQQDYSDYIDLQGLWGVEVYNTVCDVMGYTDTERPYEDLTRKGNRLLPIAADDTHNTESAFGGFTMIEAERLDYESVICAMENRDVYASTGPFIKEISIEGNTLFVRCSPAERIVVNTERRWSKTAQEKGITQASFDLSDYLRANETFAHRLPFYIRVTVMDGCGKKAWSRAYFIDELLEKEKEQCK